MTDNLKTIALDFEAELLRGVRSGAGEAELASIRDCAFGRLRAVKEGPSPPCLETIFDVAVEIGLKLDMAMKAISS